MSKKRDPLCTQVDMSLFLWMEQEVINWTVETQVQNPLVSKVLKNNDSILLQRGKVDLAICGSLHL